MKSFLRVPGARATRFLIASRLAGWVALITFAAAAAGSANPLKPTLLLALDSPAVYSDAGSAEASRMHLNRHADPSLDGRYLLFGSVAVDMIADPPGSPGSPQVFVRDFMTDTTELISTAAGDPGRAGNGSSSPVDMSADGRWVLFTSLATDLVAGVVDDAAGEDVFLHDRVAGTTLLVSRSAANPATAGNGASQAVDLSADGRWVLFSSLATDLVADLTDLNMEKDVFLYDRDSGEMRIVSNAFGQAVTGNGISEAVALSDDGGSILFHSRAADLVNGIIDANANFDVYVQDRQSGQSTLVSRASSGSTAANGASLASAISADGERVLFFSAATNLLAGVSDSNNLDDVYYWTRSSGVTTLVSRHLGMATTAPGWSLPGSISADGQWISFQSRAPAITLTGTDLEGNAGFDVYLHECATGVNRLVSRAALGSVSGNNVSAPIAISDDGRQVLYFSVASDLVAGIVDDNGVDDVYIHDRVLGSTRLVSLSARRPGHSADGQSFAGSLNAAGDRMTFFSRATDLESDLSDANGAFDVYRWDGPGSAVSLVSRRVVEPGTRRTATGRSAPRAVSEDGRWILIETTAADLAAGVEDRNGLTDLYLRDRQTGEIVLVSRSASSALQTANGGAEFGSMSPDGRWVVYRSSAINVVPGVTDGNATFDAFVFDRVAGTTTLVSHAAGQSTVAANGEARGRAISDDGRWILYQSTATNIVAGVTDGNGLDDVFLWDRQTNTALLVSRAGASNATGNAQSFSRGLSADGRWVTLLSMASNLVQGVVDPNGRFDLFLFDRQNADLRLISRAAGTNQTSIGSTLYGDMSRDGRWIGFSNLSAASDLVPGIVQTVPSYQAFLYDRDTESTVLISHAAGLPLHASDDSSFIGGVYTSADGRWWLFSSRASDLSEGVLDSNGIDDVFLYDRTTNSSMLVSQSVNPDHTGNAVSFARALSADGQRVLFVSSATDLLEGYTDLNSAEDAFSFNVTSGDRVLLTRSRLDDDQTADGSTASGHLSRDGSTIVLATAATDLIPAVLDLNQTLDSVSLPWPLPDRIFADGFDSQPGASSPGSTTSALRAPTTR